MKQKIKLSLNICKCLPSPKGKFRNKTKASKSDYGKMSVKDSTLTILNYKLCKKCF
jgi:hypothetical protein